MGNSLQYPLNGMETFVERRPLEKAIEVLRMGLFEKGTQGAFRFEVRGMHRRQR